MPQTHTPDTATLSPEQIYNLIMAGIEMDLTTEMIPHLDILYEDETPEETIERGERYAEAFAEFEGQYKAFVNGWKSYYMDVRSKALHLKRDADEKNDATDTSALEQSIQDS